MTEQATINPGTIILIFIIGYVVYKFIAAINEQHDQSGPMGHEGSGGGRVIPMPSRVIPTLPVTITLVAQKDSVASESPFAEDSLAEEARDLLVETHEMLSVGDFSVDEMPGYHLRVYTHPTKSIVGILYRDPSDRRWLNLLTEYTDGRIITTSSAEKGAINPDRPRGMPLFLFSGMPLDLLYRRHKLETRDTEKAGPITPEAFADFFHSNYARLRQSLIEKAEKREAIESVATAPPGTVRSIRRKLERQERAPSENEEDAPSRRQVQEWLQAIYEKVPIPKEEKSAFQKSLVWVLEKTPIDTVAETIKDHTGVTVTEVEKGRWVIRSEKGAEDIIEPGKLTGPELFDKINLSLPKLKQFSKLPVSLKGVAFYRLVTR